MTHRLICSRRKASPHLFDTPSFCQRPSLLPERDCRLPTQGRWPRSFQPQRSTNKIRKRPRPKWPYWRVDACVQGVFQHVKGVSNAVSGYAGGDQKTAHYEIVGSGSTGHAESVEVTFDPRQISYGRILQIYFSVAHDPTQLNRQGPDSANGSSKVSLRAGNSGQTERQDRRGRTRRQQR